MSLRFVHTCVRVRDPEASVRFYGALGFEPRGRLNFSSAYNVYMGLPGDGDTLELTVNRGQDEAYDLGTGYNHMAITVEDIHAVLADLEPLGVQPEKPPYHPGDREELPLIAFVADPDGYRIELIDGGEFPTPQDPRGLEPRDRLDVLVEVVDHRLRQRRARLAQGGEVVGGRGAADLRLVALLAVDRGLERAL